MSDYTITTDFSAKDALSSGDPEKIILGADIDVEFDAISVAVASKPDQGEIQGNTFTYFTAAGTDTYTATPSPAIASYAAGQGFYINFTNANTGPSTLNLNSLGAKSILKPGGSVLQSGDIAAGAVTQLVYDGTQFILLSPSALAVRFPRGHIAGLTLSNAADADHDITVAVGECDNMDHDVQLILSSALTKQIDASWAAGTNAGGFPTGISLTADTWYHFFLIHNTSSGAVDAGFDTSVTAANLLADATGYTEYRRIGSVLTDATSNIIAFKQRGDEFLWDAAVDDGGVAIGTTRTLVTLTVPTGIQVIAIVNVTNSDPPGSDVTALFNSPDVSEVSVTSTTQFNYHSRGASDGPVGNYRIRTNTSGQIYGDSSSSETYEFCTEGWIDARGALD